MIDEGYIKFSYNLINNDLINHDDIRDINYYRNLLYKKNYIGMKDGIGFGNISKRLDYSSFIITGSKTGGLKTLKPKHYTKIISWNYENNYVNACGQYPPSSESLTHAIFYDLDKSINAVIHIHSFLLWKKYINNMPTTSEKAKFGSIEIVNEIKLIYNNSNLKEQGVLITAGHKNGLFIFGQSLEHTMETFFKIE